jgi:hypothetical protein
MMFQIETSVPWNFVSPTKWLKILYKINFRLHVWGKMNHKWILYLDLVLIPAISHHAYANLPKSKTLILSILGKGYSTWTYLKYFDPIQLLLSWDDLLFYFAFFPSMLWVLHYLCQCPTQCLALTFWLKIVGYEIVFFWLRDYLWLSEQWPEKLYLLCQLVGYSKRQMWRLDMSS